MSVTFHTNGDPLNIFPSYHIIHMSAQLTIEHMCNTCSIKKQYSTRLGRPSP